jgi:hypothetical protein
MSGKNFTEGRRSIEKISDAYPPVVQGGNVSAMHETERAGGLGMKGF